VGRAARRQGDVYVPVLQLPGRFLDPASFSTSENAASANSSVAAPAGFASLQALFQARACACSGP